MIYVSYLMQCNNKISTFSKNSTGTEGFGNTKDRFYFIPSSFVCPKEEARKGHPSFTPACGGYLALLAVVGT